MIGKMIYAVILAGGNGERLWPMSTPERPKQFVDIFGGKPLIRHSVDRLEGFVPPERIFVITAEKLVRLTRRALPMIPKANIIGEPCRRDTAAAMAVACGLVKKHGGSDAIACVLTADQLMSPVAKVRKTLMDAAKAASRFDSVVTLGIAPNYPATGFGYIECGKSISIGTSTKFNLVKRFVEKPNLATARRYLRDSTFRWNSGMFIWKVSTLDAAFRTTAGDIGTLIDKVAAARNVRSVMKAEYPAMRKISVDFAVMEKISNIVVAEADFEWDDVGSWTSLANHFAADKSGNVALGDAVLLETENSIAVSEPGHRVALLGLSDIVVVHTKVATLVCDKSKVSDLKRLLR